ncbi:copper chaperone PCu(A)C [Mesorhizobium xinjiangense]|uniref:copper chaperone PCu(A)C n=1 Tax=Mesorhizobium xinjiangense TaxID=2678685 RepID=UPI0012ED9C77|nr:copper chaperone PCu(A)C [Mesorhizobium xinjiangense]
MKKAILLLVAIWSISLPVAADESVRILDAWARASILASRPGAAYATIESASDDRLLGVTTPAADHVMIHAVESDGDVSRMKHVEVLEIPAGQRVTLAPGGMHMMLMGLHDKLDEGTTFPMTLSFEKAGEIAVDVPVLGIAAEGPRNAEKEPGQ